MRHTFTLLASLVFTASVAAQQTSHTIAPGMTRAQVVAALGQPITVREQDGWTYVFYRNQCTRACGMNDLVVLHADSVVDAIFRSPERHYTGTSSSPAPIPAKVARRSRSGTGTLATPARRDTATARRIRKPGPPSDVNPSIPVNPPRLKPAPATEPAKKPVTTAPTTPAKKAVTTAPPTPAKKP